VVTGFAEALSAPEVVWSLIDAGCEVISFSRRGRRAALRSSRWTAIREITAPEKDSAAATNELESLLTGLHLPSRYHVFLPLDDTSLWLGSRMRVPKGWRVAGPLGEDAIFSLDKWKQIEAAQVAGFNVASSSVITNVAELEEERDCLPLMLRPVSAINHRGSALAKGHNWICSDEAELKRAAEAWQGKGALLVQPYICGGGEGVFGLAREGEVVGWSAHRRLRMMNPHGSGSSACVSQPVPNEVKASAERLIAAQRWQGLFMIELLRDMNGTPWFVEFNGRPWGSMALALRQGLNYPAWAVQTVLGQKPLATGKKATAGGMECRNLGRDLVHLLFVLRGPKSQAVQRWPSFWHSVREQVRIPRRLSFYNWRSDDWRVFVADTWITIREQILKRPVKR